MLFRKRKPELSPTDAAEAFQTDLAALIRAAEQHHAGRPALITALDNALAVLRYSAMVTTPHSAATISTIEHIGAD